MTYKAKLKVHFDTEWTPTYGGSGIYDDETLPEEHYTFEIPCQDINSIQLFRFFGTVARTMGHNDLGIMKGACSLAFNDMQSQEDMRKVAEEFELTLAEDLQGKFKDWKEAEEAWTNLRKGPMGTHLENEDAMYWKNKYIEELAAQGKLDNVHQPESHQYSEEELDAMCDAAANVSERDKCREYNLREAEYYDKRAQLALEHNNGTV